jgi:putative heme iron utilization protein
MRATTASGDPAALARRLLRQQQRAALGTSLRGAPYVSLVLLVADLDASPLLLLSDLAQHSRNIAFDPRVSLLLDATAEYPDPLTGPRLTVLGRAEAVADPWRLARFTAHHPTSALYSGFGDFRLYRVAINRGHLVAGFGRIHWIDGGDLAFAGDIGALAAREREILHELNEHHRDAIASCAQRLLGHSPAPWQAIGIDPEGLDLRGDRDVVRLEFPAPALTPEAVRAALAALAAKAG